MADVARLEVDLDSIHLPRCEDYGIASDDEDVVGEDDLEFDSGFGNVIVVDGLPVVPPEKFEKLWAVIRKCFSPFGIIKDGGFWMPVDPQTQKTLGYCFIEYNTPHEAELAKEKLHGRNLDKKYVFNISMFDDFNRFMKVPEEWAPPEVKPYAPRENPQKWLTDE